MFFFEPTPEIDSYIRNADLDVLRGVLVGIINRDPTFATTRYQEALDYICREKKINIWDSEKRNLIGEYEIPSNEWDKEYFRRLLAWLSQNFVQERVDYIKKVGERVYAEEYTWGKDEAENFLRPVAQTNRNPRKSQSVIGRIILALFLGVALAIVAILVIEVSVKVRVLVLILLFIAAIIAILTIIHRKKSARGSGKELKT